MNKFYEKLKKLRIWIEDSPKVLVVLIFLIAISWGSNIFISNKITWFSNRPNIIFIIEALSITFNVITGIYALLSFFYLRIDKIDSLELSKKYQSMDENNRRISSELSLKEKDIRKNCRDLMKKLFDDFNLDSSSRITVFFTKDLSRNPDKFNILERYSTGGRQAYFRENDEYLVSIGVIKHIWENGFHCDVGVCPPYSESGRKKQIKRDRYIQHQYENYQISEEMCKNMNMKSCDFVGINLSDDISNVILLFESRKSNSLNHINESSLKRHLSKNFKKDLLFYVELLNWLLDKRKNLSASVQKKPTGSMDAELMEAKNNESKNK